MATLSGEGDEVAATAIAERGMIATMRFVSRELPQRVMTWTQETLQACEDVDVLTGGVGGMVVGLSVAEKLGKPFLQTHLQPISAPTAAYPGVLLAGTPLWLGKPGLLLSHYLSDFALWMPFQKAMIKARREVLGLAGTPRASTGYPILYGFSPHVLQMAAKGAHARHITGYWTFAGDSSAAWQPPPAIEEFLKLDARPVVSVGFGSMASSDPQRLTELLVAAVRQAGVRAVRLAGWGGLEVRQMTKSSVRKLYRTTGYFRG